MALLSGGGKLSGKNESIVLRRRSTTRRSGFSVKDGNTGGTYEIGESEFCYRVSPDTPLIIDMKVPQEIDVFSGFGLWLAIDNDPSNITITQTCGLKVKLLKKIFAKPNWSKLGSMWIAQTNAPADIGIEIQSKVETFVYVYDALAGTVSEPQLDVATEALKRNMHSFSPEALFIAKAGKIELSGEEVRTKKKIYLKNCNRCGRYLPINVDNERNHLSFSNHCTAPHKVPCSDSTFSKLRQAGEDSPSLVLKNGFQLECRFCKKFYVNAPLNPQRTTAQMREDGQRRRAFELLINNALGVSPVIQYKETHDGRELADDIWEKFGKHCFKCNAPLKLSEINLDHTRPLALLWPLDETATCLCKDCNGDKRDRTPSDFYTEAELRKLSEITGIALKELKSPDPNLKVLELLWERRDWIFGTFFESASMAKIREGKDTRMLIVKALDKASKRAPKAKRYDFKSAYSDFLKNRN